MNKNYDFEKVVEYQQSNVNKLKNQNISLKRISELVFDIFHNEYKIGEFNFNKNVFYQEFKISQENEFMIGVLLELFELFNWVRLTEDYDLLEDLIEEEQEEEIDDSLELLIKMTPDELMESFIEYLRLREKGEKIMKFAIAKIKEKEYTFQTEVQDFKKGDEVTVELKHGKFDTEFERYVEKPKFECKNMYRK